MDLVYSSQYPSTGKDLTVYTVSQKPLDSKVQQKCTPVVVVKPKICYEFQRKMQGLPPVFDSTADIYTEVKNSGSLNDKFYNICNQIYRLDVKEKLKIAYALYFKININNFMELLRNVVFDNKFFSYVCFFNFYDLELVEWLVYILNYQISIKQFILVNEIIKMFPKNVYFDAYLQSLLTTKLGFLDHKYIYMCPMQVIKYSSITDTMDLYRLLLLYSVTYGYQETVLTSIYDRLMDVETNDISISLNDIKIMFGSCVINYTGTEISNNLIKLCGFVISRYRTYEKGAVDVKDVFIDIFASNHDVDTKKFMFKSLFGKELCIELSKGETMFDVLDACIDVDEDFFNSLYAYMFVTAGVSHETFKPLIVTKNVCEIDILDISGSYFQQREKLEYTSSPLYIKKDLLYERFNRYACRRILVFFTLYGYIGTDIEMYSMQKILSYVYHNFPIHEDLFETARIHFFHIYRILKNVDF